MGIELKKDIPSPIWQNSVTVRHYILGVDDERLHQAFNEAFADHWNSKSSTLEEFYSVQKERISSYIMVISDG